MASDFMIGATVEGLTSLDELTTPLPDPQPQFRKFLEMERLGNLKLRGAGPQTVIWVFPMLEVEQVQELDDQLSDDPVYIQSLDRFDAPHVYEVLMNVPSPVQDGEHIQYFAGMRGGYEVEFIILAEVDGS